MSMPDAHDIPHLSPSDVVRSGLCIGCGSCVAQSRGGGAMAFDGFGLLKPTGPRSWFERPSPDLARTCPFSSFSPDEDDISTRVFPKAPYWHSSSGRFRSAWVGHVSDTRTRLAGSSGGMVTWVLTELLNRGLIDGVAHVKPVKGGTGLFEYGISRTVDEISQGAKSRYYPIEMSRILTEIRNVPGRYAIVGIPCFIKAIQLLRMEDKVVADRLVYTLALFCGHMKSSRFVDSFAVQMGIEPDTVSTIDFRYKQPERPANWYCAEVATKDGDVRRQDWWGLADGDWGAGYFMSSACNYCDDVVGETADVSFGDAWVEPYSSDGGGTNVVVTRSAAIEKIVRDGIATGDVSLRQVDGDFVEQTQAAGLRQRREGLAYRLTWSISPKILKRVEPCSDIPVRRKLIYRCRYWISALSHRVFSMARTIGFPAVYIYWARAAAAIYHGFAYSRGRFGALVDKFSSPVS